MRADCARMAAAMSSKARSFCAVGAKRQHAGSLPRAAADLGHGGGDIARSLDAFQRRAHAG